MLLLDVPTKHRYKGQTPAPGKTLSEQIRYVNHRTGVRTSSHNVVGEPVEAFPDGLGLYGYGGSPALLAQANADAIRLFVNDFRNYEPHHRPGEFVALFWNAPNNTLERMMTRLSAYVGLCELLRTVHVPLIARALGVSESTVMTAPSEVIYYPPEGGIEQHIDNVTRTEGRIGPVCSICFVTGRAFDMLPSLAAGEPFRLWTEPGDLLILSGAARLTWSHSVPYDAGQNRYSVVIRPIVNGGVVNTNRAEMEWTMHLPTPFRFDMTEEEARYVTYPHDAIKIQRKLAELAKVKVLVDLFACVGGDTLAAAFVHRTALIIAIQRAEDDKEKARFGRLVDNVRRFRPLCHRTQRIQCVAHNAEAWVPPAGPYALYMDPPWENKSAKQVAQHLQVAVLGRLEPQIVCVKLPGKVVDWGSGYKLRALLRLGRRFFVHFLLPSAETRI